ncbi:MAG: hypothetical protein LBL61_06250 [Elusimicrobiota bacterium]|nr:hypothetical protein [Elusimicrobiota bacterium]
MKYLIFSWISFIIIAILIFLTAPILDQIYAPNLLIFAKYLIFFIYVSLSYYNNVKNMSIKNKIFIFFIYLINVPLVFAIDFILYANFYKGAI